MRTFLLLLGTVEAQWGYRILNYDDPADALVETLEDLGT
jgi:hypothetical protein